LIVRIRIRPGDGATLLSFDTFNDPHLALPAVGEVVGVSFAPEACLVLEGSEGATAPVDAVEAAEAAVGA